MVTEESKQDKQGQSEKVLDRNDLVWQKYKNKHFANTKIAISNEITRFVKENKNIDAIKKGEEMGVTDLKDIMASMPKYQELISIYSKHLTLIEKADENLKNRNMINLIKVEQMIISGIDSKGNEVSAKDIIKEIEKIYKELDTIDHIRLLMIYIACYDVPEKDLQVLLSTLNSSHHD